MCWSKVCRWANNGGYAPGGALSVCDDHFVATGIMKMGDEMLDQMASKKERLSHGIGLGTDITARSDVMLRVDARSSSAR